MEELSLIEDQRAEFTYHTLVAHWITKVDRINKDFFSMFYERYPGSTLRSIWHQDGLLPSQLDTVLSWSTDYLESLFSPDV